jgi:hypothetical protein
MRGLCAVEDSVCCRARTIPADRGRGGRYIGEGDDYYNDEGEEGEWGDWGEEGEEGEEGEGGSGSTKKKKKKKEKESKKERKAREREERRRAKKGQPLHKPSEGEVPTCPRPRPGSWGGGWGATSARKCRVLRRARGRVASCGGPVRFTAPGPSVPPRGSGCRAGSPGPAGCARWRLSRRSSARRTSWTSECPASDRTDWTRRVPRPVLIGHHATASKAAVLQGLGWGEGCLAAA